MSEKNKEDILALFANKYLSGYTISQAMLEDYAEVISKIEGVELTTIKERITKRANEIRKEFLNTIPQNK